MICELRSWEEICRGTRVVFWFSVFMLYSLGVLLGSAALVAMVFVGVYPWFAGTLLTIIALRFVLCKHSMGINKFMYYTIYKTL